MNLTIKYFGMLSDVTRCTEEKIAFSRETISDLLKTIYEKHPAIRGKDFQVAQNNRIVPKEATVTSSEIALLPPFAGG